MPSATWISSRDVSLLAIRFVLAISARYQYATAGLPLHSLVACAQRCGPLVPPLERMYQPVSGNHGSRRNKGRRGGVELGRHGQRISGAPARAAKRGREAGDGKA